MPAEPAAQASAEPAANVPAEPAAQAPAEPAANVPAETAAQAPAEPSQRAGRARDGCAPERRTRRARRHGRAAALLADATRASPQEADPHAIAAEREAPPSQDPSSEKLRDNVRAGGRRGGCAFRAPALREPPPLDPPLAPRARPLPSGQSPTNG